MSTDVISSDFDSFEEGGWVICMAQRYLALTAVAMKGIDTINMNNDGYWLSSYIIDIFFNSKCPSDIKSFYIEPFNDEVDEVNEVKCTNTSDDDYHLFVDLNRRDLLLSIINAAIHDIEQSEEAKIQSVLTTKSEYDQLFEDRFNTKVDLNFYSLEKSGFSNRALVVRVRFVLENVKKLLLKETPMTYEEVREYVKDYE